MLRLFLASLFGALIGLERERKEWTAGLRTHMMVCVGSCLIMIVSAFGFSDILGTAHVDLDPSRIAAQVISGIGFIGAGTILFVKQGTVHGLTTAAGLWTVAAIGLATGGGLYFAAGATASIALIILLVLKPLEYLYIKKYKQKMLKIVADTKANSTDILRELADDDAKIQNFSFERNGNECVYQLSLEGLDAAKINTITDKLKNNSSIKGVFWL